jgi:hypothetical protein
MITTFCGEKRFEYWDDAKLVDIVDPDVLIETYTAQDGEHHYFDDDTMEFFGTEDFQMVAPGISIEYQANAPEGVDRWTVVCWVVNEENDIFTPYTLCRHSDMNEAAVCGHISYQQLDKQWCGLTHEGFCSDHGEDLQAGCSRCSNEEV